MTAPVPWSLAWREDGELAAQDHFDLLQTLVASEDASKQVTLIAAVERMTMADLSVISGTTLTRQWA